MSLAEVEPGPGLFEVTDHDGQTSVTNIRKIAGKDRERGQVLLNVFTSLLVLLDAGVLAVSFAAQYRFIYQMRGQQVASLIEAGMLDVALIIVSGLGIAISLRGKSSKAARALIVVFASASAGMNYAAADTSLWRSIVVYAAPPVVLAIITDFTIGIIRRFYLNRPEPSAWLVMGRAAAAVLVLAGRVLLALLAIALSPRAQLGELRRMVLAASPMSGAPEVPALTAEPARAGEDQALPEPCAVRFSDQTACTVPGPCPDHSGPFATKKQAFLSFYRAHPSYGIRAVSSRVAGMIAGQVDLSQGGARTYVIEELNRLEAAAKRSEITDGAS
jgi:hypothetical protein